MGWRRQLEEECRLRVGGLRVGGLRMPFLTKDERLHAFAKQAGGGRVLW